MFVFRICVFRPSFRRFVSRFFFKLILVFFGTVFFRFFLFSMDFIVILNVFNILES